MAEEQDEQQQQNMLDVAVDSINEQVKIASSNFRIALEKTQPDIIYKFWYTITYDLTSKAYFFTMGDQVFEVNADLVRNALRITPKDPDHPFTLHAPEKEIISFINQLGCYKTIRMISALRVNDIYQPLRTFLTMIKKYLTRKATTYDRPRLHMLKLLWGMVTSTIVDFFDLIWEEFKYQIES
ncbi:hypothetical protein Tco_0596188 [Tanacetum coccineum]